MIESFPVLSDSRQLTVDDFSRFSRSYAEILLRHLPSVKHVVFALTTNQAEEHFQNNPLAQELLSLFVQVKDGMASHGIHAGILMLSFNVKNGVRSVAIVTGADPLFLQKVSDDWLLEKREAVEREFLLLKQARVDSQTGLLNLSNLHYLLDTYGSTKGLHIILLELVPKRNSFHFFLRYSHKCATLLQNFVRGGSVLHYLGQSTFALVLQQSNDEERPDIESALVAYLKREGCHRVHIGSSCSGAMEEDEDQGNRGRQLLDEAWTALRHAVKRGPFSFCDFSVLAHPENHPLAPPDRNLVRRLSRMWRNSDSFCLVQFRGDSEACSATSVVPEYIDRGVTIQDGDDVFVYLDGAEAGETLRWAREVIRRIRGVGDPEKNVHVSAGVSKYPYSDFKKTEIVANCRKALLHGAFFGESSAVIFDAVSLNISGDIYFGDGDLAKAVKEYKRGLQCDSQDINLHNSLGVALAMMNKLSPAMLSFEKGLVLDSNNFMALYNLGLAEQTKNRKPEAVKYLDRALQHYSDEEGGRELVSDLILQLGILSCEIGNYQAAVSHLLSWQRENKNARNAGRVHYFLGAAYHGLKNNRNAMEALQRALQFDEFDDRALNLLGRVYLEEGEGDEIALSLCRKSVELAPSNLHYILHLAEAQLQCGLLQEARDNLHKCLKNRSYRKQAQFLLGKSYAREGQHRRAKSWFKKVMMPGENQQDLCTQAEQELTRLKGV